jgi:hypothetical protein
LPASSRGGLGFRLHHHKSRARVVRQVPLRSAIAVRRLLGLFDTTDGRRSERRTNPKIPPGMMRPSCTRCAGKRSASVPVPGISRGRADGIRRGIQRGRVEEERRGADFAARSREPTTAARSGFVQSYTGELAMTAIILSWCRGDAERPASRAGFHGRHSFAQGIIRFAMKLPPSAILSSVSKG